MRLKLEEEYTQNTKNHEEEVQLRLKFEAKLNEMHGDYRELNSKYQRSQKDLAEAKIIVTETTSDLKEKVNENTNLNQTIIDQKARMNVQLEKVSSLQRELSIKSTQLTEFETRLNNS
jgi:hypothetical protein